MPKLNAVWYEGKWNIASLNHYWEVKFEEIPATLSTLTIHVKTGGIYVGTWHFDILLFCNYHTFHISFELSMKSSDFEVIAKCHLCLTLDMRLTSFVKERCGMTFRNVTWHVWKPSQSIHSHIDILSTLLVPIGLTLTLDIYLRTFMTYF